MTDEEHLGTVGEMPEAIKPALTPQEWATAIAHGDAGRLYAAELWRRHGVAALALHNQPCGFTWEDVDRLRQIAQEVREPERTIPVALLKARDLDDIADRIEALLPPRLPRQDQG